jgi:predicted alpha/beta hydrolase
MVLPEPLTFEADDKYPVKGFCWRHPEAGLEPTPVVIINPATSVLCRYYFRFAVFLFEHGFDVIAYDYRGIGESRAATLSVSQSYAAGFNAVLQTPLDDSNG